MHSFSTKASNFTFRAETSGLKKERDGSYFDDADILQLNTEEKPIEDKDLSAVLIYDAKKIDTSMCLLCKLEKWEWRQGIIDSTLLTVRRKSRSTQGIKQQMLPSSHCHTTSQSRRWQTHVWTNEHIKATENHLYSCGHFRNHPIPTRSDYSFLWKWITFYSTSEISWSNAVGVLFHCPWRKSATMM